MQLNRSCGHIMTTGDTCGAYALKDSDLCYWHHKALLCHQQRMEPRQASGLVLPLFEDANSIQLAVQMIAQAIADRRISRSEAGALLYSIQLAISNLKNVELPKEICTWRVIAIPTSSNALGDIVQAPEIPVKNDPAFNYGKLKDEDEDEDDDDEDDEEEDPDNQEENEEDADDEEEVDDGNEDDSEGHSNRRTTETESTLNDLTGKKKHAASASSDAVAARTNTA